MNEHNLVSIERIFKFLERCEPMEPNSEPPLEVFTLSGQPVFLHTDVNIEEKYGCIYEWWLSSESDDYIDGGFEPACSDDEVVQLAGIIHAACEKIIDRQG